MEILSKLLLFTHIAAGAVTLLSGPVAIFYNFKDPRKHRAAGKLFFYAMLVVCFSSIAGFIKRPDQLFYQFLLGIALLVLAGILRGVRAVMLMKGGKVTRFDFAYSILLGVLGVLMIGQAGRLMTQDVIIAMPILFGVFGLSALSDSYRNIRIFTNPARMRANDWMRLHLHSMVGAFIASSTAFTVNAAHFLPWYMQWFGPTLLLVPINIYFGRKVKSMAQTA